ncbi:MAG TPA: hypothetical protein VM695_09925 [Phycisphaerae bacterium]|nr:hypothetical protein [Phycisphaerae bacterium]
MTERIVFWLLDRALSWLAKRLAARGAQQEVSDAEYLAEVRRRLQDVKDSLK